MKPPSDSAGRSGSMKEMTAMMVASTSPTAAFLSEPPAAKAVPLANGEEAAFSAVDDDAPLQAWLVGTGTPRTVADRAGPCTLVRRGDYVAIFDCGAGTTMRLAALGVGLDRVRQIFITHHHVDHNAELGMVLVNRWLQSRGRLAPPLVVGPAGTVEFVDRALALFDYDVRVRLLKGLDVASLHTPVLEIGDGDRVEGAPWRVQAIRVHHEPVDEAFGYRVDAKDRSIVVSGDTTPNDNLISVAQRCDVLVHEVIFPGVGYPEYHTLVDDVGKVATAAATSHLALTHLLPGDLSDREWLHRIEPHFEGRVTVGRDLTRVL